MGDADISDFPYATERQQFETWVLHGIQRKWLPSNALTRVLDGSRMSLRILRIPEDSVDRPPE